MPPTNPTQSTRRSNEARSKATRNNLIQAARVLFVENGYNETGTPDIVRMAKVTRGALYHHFADKKDLLSAVVREEASAVAQHIRDQASQPISALDALLDGTRGYFEALALPGRAKLLLVEGPSILGPEHMAKLNHETSTVTLEDGLAIALGIQTPDEGVPIKELAQILGAGFDAAALAIAQGAEMQPYQDAFAFTFKQLLRKN